MAEELLNWAVQLGATGVLAWLIYYLFTRGIPSVFDQLAKMQCSFVDALKSQDDKFLNQITEQRMQFSADLREIQKINIDSYREHKSAIITAINENTQATRDLQVKVAAMGK